MDEDKGDHPKGFSESQEMQMENSPLSGKTKIIMDIIGTN